MKIIIEEGLVAMMIPARTNLGVWYVLYQTQTASGTVPDNEIICLRLLPQK